MIRPLRVGDVAPVLALWRGLMADGEAADARTRLRDDATEQFRPFVADEWTRADPFVRCWVAEDGELYGFVTLYPVQRLPLLDRPPVAMIGDCYVRPDRRGAGVGRSLVAAAAAAARAAGFPALEVGTLIQDVRAVSFWRALGFVDERVVLLRSP